MKLLLDANISWKLTKLMVDDFEEIRHVDFIAELSKPPKDIEIWEWAAKNDFVIIRNDEDFLNLALVKGYPPKVVLLRTGNQSNVFIKNMLALHKLEIQSFIGSVSGVLEIY